MKKRTLALGLVLALCIGLFPVQTVAAGETDPVAAAREAGVLTYFDETFVPDLTGTVTYYDVAKIMAGVADYEIDLSQVEDTQRDQAIYDAVKGTLMNHMGGGSASCDRRTVAANLHNTLYYRAKTLADINYSIFLKQITLTKQFLDLDSGDTIGERITKLYNIDVLTPGDEEGNFLPNGDATWQDLLTWATAAKLWATTSPDSQENLPLLTAPTDLVWGVRRWDKTDGTVGTKEIPGYVSFYAESGHQNHFCVTFYKQGETQPIWSGGWSAGNSGDLTRKYFGIDFFLWLTAGYQHRYSDPELDRFDIEDGYYYFTIKAVGDKIKYRDSEESAPSENFEYVKPNVRLAPPVNLRWDGTTAKFSPAPGSEGNINSYYIACYYSETDELSLDNLTEADIGGGSSGSLAEWEIPDSYIQRSGPGYYFFRVCAWSADINQYQGSDWSELSPAYHLTDIPTKDSLGDILASAEGKTPEEVRSAVQELNTGDLKNALLADRNEAGGTADLLGQLEGKTGITVTTAAEKPEFEDMASNAKIVGAALNDVPEGTDTITLNIGSPEKEHVIPEQYHNAVALRFGMGLDGVVDQENLKVPVRVTLPIPAAINPQFLVLLHYGQDGSMEELGIDRVYTFQQEGRWYASFVLTHFSDFILTELKQEEPEPTPTPTPTPTPPSGGGSSGGGGGGGGGSSAPTYSIATAAVSNGKVELSPKKAEKGTKVTVTLTPDKGYVVAELTVLDGKGKAVALTEAGEGKYTFIMPASKVEVKALFREEPPAAPVETPAPAVPVSQRFTDIKADSWYTGAVQYVCDKGLMEGMSRDAFVPEGPLTRGALVTILYRLEGEPGTSSPSFRDVPAGQWYAAGVSWASGQGIVNGYGDDSFRPEAPVTRDQLVTILYRYAVWKKGSTAIQPGQSGFPDEAQTSAYARQAVRWALASGLINGYSDGTFRPEGRATRAEIAALLMRFCEEILK